jgi:hypothetical protein
MPTLPPGTDPAYVWCLGWFIFEAVLIGLFSQQMTSNGVEERVRSRTYARLGRLNDYLTRRIEAAFNKVPTDDMVPDLDVLRELDAQVSRAIAVDRAFRSRASALTLGRLIAVLELALAALAAALVFLSAPRDALTVASVITLVGGGVPTAALLVSASVLSVRIETGEDFL